MGRECLTLSTQNIARWLTTLPPEVSEFLGLRLRHGYIRLVHFMSPITVNSVFSFPTCDEQFGCDFQRKTFNFVGGHCRLVSIYIRFYNLRGISDVLQYENIIHDNINTI